MPWFCASSLQQQWLDDVWSCCASFGRANSKTEDRHSGFNQRTGACVFYNPDEELQDSAKNYLQDVVRAA
jgi:hypothetical protein